MAGKAKTLEESFSQMEEILVRLEDRDTPLEEAFTLYQEGMKLLKSCNDKLDKVEQKMLTINENGETNEFS